MTRIPIACTLADPDRALRQRKLQDEVGSAVVERRELEDGFALRFPADSGWVSRLAELIGFERQCCPFLTLELIAEPARGPIWLRVRGPEGTKEFLRSAFEACGAG